MTIMLKLKTVTKVKKILILFLIILNFESLTKADDIKSITIEGISIGDSALYQTLANG